MKITFDTNVWEPLVEEEKPHLIEIKTGLVMAKFGHISVK